MKQHPTLTQFITSLLIYGLISIIFITGLGCGLAFNLAPQVSGLMSEPTSNRTWQKVHLPTLTPTPTMVSEVSYAGHTQTAAQLPVQLHDAVAATTLMSNIATPAAPADQIFGSFRPIPASSLQQVPSAIPARSGQEAIATSTQPNTPAFIATFNPTLTPTPTVNAGPTRTLLPDVTPTPARTSSASPLPSPTATPDLALAPGLAYDFLLGEFYNSPTTNSFLLIYVAVVDPNEIPIGDMKIVGTRLDHNLTYESPLTTWYYEGYNAPGEHIKSGNVKFEPPGGIETTSWVLHLEDDHGQRQSEDIPFDVDETNKQWYFIKFRRSY